MRKAKENFAAIHNIGRALSGYDFSHKGFAVVDKERMIYVLERTDIEIRNGNEYFMEKFIELADKYPNYQFAILHSLFLF